jgi:hypothetical protein
MAQSSYRPTAASQITKKRAAEAIGSPFKGTGLESNAVKKVPVIFALFRLSRGLRSVFQ